MENKVTFERLNYLRLKDIAPVWSKLLEEKEVSISLFPCLVKMVFFARFSKELHSG